MSNQKVQKEGIQQFLGNERKGRLTPHPKARGNILQKLNKTNVFGCKENLLSADLKE